MKSRRERFESRHHHVTWCARPLGSNLYWFGLLVLGCCLVSACDPNAFWNKSIDDPRIPGSNAEAREALSNGKVIGFVLANFDWLTYPSVDGKSECPSGFTHTNRDNWEVQFPTQAARQRHLKRCGDIRNRGPNCENVWFAPDVIKDPLPHPTVEGRIAYGLDLDGIQTDMATPRTCAHEEFQSPEGEPGIDNQYYRFLGCNKGLRDVPGETIRSYVASNLIFRLLLEIKGVDDERNDGAVEIAMYRGGDPLLIDAAGKALPWQSQRIDQGPQKLLFRVRGRIIDGVLLTDPADVMWDGTHWERRLLIRAMRLRLQLNPTGAEGFRVGYIDVPQLWEGYARQGSATGTSSGGSAPSAFTALHLLADGYKDPRNGACTALSSARRFEFVRAYVIHPAREASQ